MKEHKLKDMECMSETEKLTTKADGSETFSKTWVFEGENLKVTIVGTQSMPFEPGQKQNIIFQQPQSTIEEFQEEAKIEEAAKEETFQEHITGVKEREAKSTLLISAEAFNNTFDTLGGLEKDVIVEKNEKDKFLFAHAFSVEDPGTDKHYIKLFCEQLREFSAGIRWMHIDTNLFNANQGDLNKEEPVEEGKPSSKQLKELTELNNATFIKTTRVQGKEKQIEWDPNHPDWVPPQWMMDHMTGRIMYWRGGKIKPGTATDFDYDNCITLERRAIIELIPFLKKNGFLIGLIEHHSREDDLKIIHRLLDKICGTEEHEG